MKLTINGISKDYPQDLTVKQLLAQLDLAPELVVVELNRNILTPDMHAATTLTGEDNIELVQFVGGG